MKVRLFLAVLAVLLFLSGLCAVTSAQWVVDGVVVCDEVEDQDLPVITTDGRGGAIIVWEDSRDWATNYWDIYVQRVDSAGYMIWTPNGFPLCDTVGDQVDPSIVPDGHGGAIVAWNDYRGGNWDIYAQRVDSSGNIVWQDDGIAVCTFAGEQSYLEMIEDGQGGAIVTWNDNRSGEYDIYVQRIDADGNLLWSPDGVSVCTASGWQIEPDPTTDGHNGAIITWQDGRSDYNIYAQRVDSSGVCQWTADGVPVCMVLDVQEYPEITTDGKGGALITWRDRRDNSDIYAQRVDSGGAARWTPNGTPVCTDASGQWNPQIVADDSVGAVIVWGDERNWPYPDIYAQRVDSAGQVQWAPDGIPICDAPEEQHLYSQGDVVATDGSGGAIVTWTDYRNAGIHDIYAQRVSHDGIALWDSNGVAIALGPPGSSQLYPSLVSDGRCGAIVCWEDGRNDVDLDIYAQKVDSAGAVGTGVGETPVLHVESCVLGPCQSCPNPFSNRTVIEYSIPTAAPVSLKLYNILGEKVRTLIKDEVRPGRYSVIWDGRNGSGRAMAGGVYFCRLQVGKLSQVHRIVLLR